MKALRVAAGVALVLVVAACGGTDDGAAEGPSMPDVVGEQLDVALSDIEGAGFEEEVDIAGGGTFGVIDESNWTVCEQSPAAGRSITAAPELTVDRSCEEDVPETSTPTTESAPPTTAAPTTAVPEEALTTTNSPELAAILAGQNDCTDEIEAFASTNEGRTIEFDGNVAYVAPGDGDTLYRVLIYAGDYSETSAAGPAFQFQNVGNADLPTIGSDLSAAAGMNVRVVGRVQDFDRGSCLFPLEPVSLSPR